MQIIKGLQQGSPEWIAHRKNYHNASDAPAMMGASNYKSRNELLQERKTGFVKPISDFQQRLFDAGHETEQLARAILERELGLDLYPVTAIKDGLGASFDGMTLDGKVIFEHKLYNESKAADIANKLIPRTDYWQVVQQLYISNADKCFYVVSDGTPEKRATLEVKREDIPQADFDALIAGWAQFDKDLSVFEPVLERTDDEYKLAAQEYREAEQALKEAKERHENARAALLEIGGDNAEGFGVKITTSERKGSIDYALYVKDNGLDVSDDYRKPTTTTTRITVKDI